MKTQELFEAPRGPDWKVLFKVRSKDGDAWESGSFVVQDYVGKERARSAALTYMDKKFKGRECSITRITQVPWKKA